MEFAGELSDFVHRVSCATLSLVLCKVSLGPRPLQTIQTNIWQPLKRLPSVCRVPGKSKAKASITPKSCSAQIVRVGKRVEQGLVAQE